jgi:dTDP-4-amino-4,6-dideoxygalactose transaminase
MSSAQPRPAAPYDESERPVRTTLLPLTRPWMDETEARAAYDAVMQGDIIGAGRLGRGVEDALMPHLGGRRPLFLNSCTSALETAVLLAGAAPDTEVILPSFTFVSCANAVVRPVFADIDPRTLNIDPAEIERRITARTRAVIVVHYAGRPCDMAAILDLAGRRGIKVIEDAAHALGGRWQEQPAGTIGDFGCFSFHGTKDIVCGEGGALVCRSGDDTRRAEIIREKGTNRAAFLRGDVDKYTWVDEGSSLVNSDVLAAILRVQVDRLPAVLARKRALADRLTAGLQPVADRLELPRELPGTTSTWHLYPVIVEAGQRDDVLQALRAEGIGAAFHYVPLHDSPYARRRFGYRTGDLPHTERISASLIRLPLYAAMSDDDVDDVARATVKVLQRRTVSPRS